MAEGPQGPQENPGPPPERPRQRSGLWSRLASDSFVGILSGIISGVLSAAVLVAFSDNLRDLAIRLRTAAPPGHVLMLYDPREPPKSGPSVTYNLYGVRENDEFDGTFGRRNDDGTTNYDLSFRYKGFARDGQMYLTYAPAHGERYGSGQFQSVNRLDNDIYYGLAVATICNKGQSSTAVQRVLVGVIARIGQEKQADEAAAALLQPVAGAPNLRPIYDLNLSTRDCIRSLPVKKAS